MTQVQLATPFEKAVVHVERKLKKIPKGMLPGATATVETFESTPVDGPSPFLKEQRVVIEYDDMTMLGRKYRKSVVVFTDTNPPMDDVSTNLAHQVAARINERLSELPN